MSPPDAPARNGPPELVAASENALTLAGDSASVDLAVPDRTRALVASAASGGSRVLLRLDDIKGEVNPGVVYGVYLDLPPDADVNSRRNYHVGNVALFGIEKMNDPDVLQNCPPGFPHVFDATSVVSKLVKEGRWDPAAVTVTFQPIDPLPPPGEEETWKSEPPARSVSPIQIGRVGIFLG
jgi:tyrosinase